MKLTTIKSLAAAALCAVGITATAAEPEAVQLWEGGPYWATVNVGTAEQGAPAEYGALYKFGDAAQAVTDALGEGWRVPTEEELKKLAGENTGDKVCSNVWTTCNGVAGRRFFGMTSGYEDKSIFLPAAGVDQGDGNGRKYAGGDGYYWSSTEENIDYAHALDFDQTDFYWFNGDRSQGFSVRAVRDTPLVTGPTVTVGEVTTGEPWSTITVNYTLGGTDAKTDYKVAFDVTANGKTAGVTNDAAKVEDKAYSQQIDTAALFGAATPDTKAKVKVSLIAIKPKAN